MLLTLLQVRRAVEGTISNIDEIIGDFEGRFTQLRLEFLMSTTIQVAQMAFLILEKAAKIGAYLCLPYSDMLILVDDQKPSSTSKHFGWLKTQRGPDVLKQL